MTNYDGGYLFHQIDLFRRGLNAHTSELEDPASQAALNAINSVQETPWRINSWMLDVVRELWNAGIEVKGLPKADDKPLPKNVDEALWATYTDEQKRTHKRQKAKAYTENGKMVSKRDSLLRVLSVAQEMVEYEEIYFPHAFDFRFRMYPIPQDLQPQRDDVAKSLLMFAEGKPLGHRGAYWLSVQLANTFGFDKATLDERVDWVLEHLDDIVASAQDPIENRFWMEADEPFQFLAACHEYEMLWEQGFDAVSHLPIQVDGSCNGLQHLSALGRDRVGATATNVAANQTREDIYLTVADKVSRLVAKDVAEGIPEATKWAGNINRKTVKRAVMTTPYSVTDRGIRDQLIDDNITHTILGDEEGHQAHAAYLTKVIREAMSDTVISATEIMSYLQKMADAFAKAEMPFVWTTPSGCKVSQAYYHIASRQIRTLFGLVSVAYEDTNRQLNTSKARNGAAPNVIHSFDAAHLQLTVNRCVEEYGIECFSVIHDSFGTHACDMDNMSRALRETFCDIYTQDVLANFHEEQLAIAEPLGIELPDCPMVGDFDVTEVLKSPFFFA